MVPVCLDALLLGQDQMLVAANTDFSQQPFSTTTQDFNPNVANLSEDIVSQPFDNQNLYLKAGIHLHWSLPDALTKGKLTPQGTDFPAVPNRWLVVRTQKATSGQRTVEQAWVVESDYLFPDDASEQTECVTIPFDPDPASGYSRPFRYLGRKLPLNAWQAESSDAEYLTKLTAIGYGEPTFAAFYPNCLSVFGLYDDTYLTPPTGLTYDVIGWYSDQKQDALALAIAKRLANSQQTPAVSDLQAAVVNAYQWQATLQSDQEFPNQMVCYARLTFNPPQESYTHPTRNNPAVNVACGNTSMEALSAYLGSQVDAQQKATIEDELEALQLADRLEHRRLDIGAKFREARHENGFVATKGGSLWGIQPVTDHSLPADAANTQAQANLALPDDFAQKLDTLNIRQQSYDQAIATIEALRKQLFADWYKYMLCTYPPDDAKEDYPDADEVRYYIEQQDLAPLQQALTTAGQLALTYDDGGGLTSVSASTPACLANDVALSINGLIGDLAAFNASNTVKNAKTSFALKGMPAPRYWQPRDPTLLVVGPTVVPTARHGQDGLLTCQIFPNKTVQDLLPGQSTAFTNFLDALEHSSQGQAGGLSTWIQQPWNPFLLEWEVEVSPLSQSSNLHPETTSYAPDFINSNYTLPADQPDLSPLPDKNTLIKAANVYSGSSILTPYAAENLKGQLEDYLNDPDVDKTTDTYQHVRQADNLLGAASFHALSQALGGLNEALLMHKQTQQLAIADPLGFADDQAFTQAVNQAVQQSNTSAPQPQWDFNPIRSGALNILRLRLVDTFGQTQDLSWKTVVATEQMSSIQYPDWITLPPRLPQAACLNFRWLAANGDAMEVNDQATTTPICGWILPNNLDSSLMIYDNQGKILGIINELARWDSQVPGSPGIELNAIPNLHLRKMVQYLVNQGAPSLANFLSSIDTALENIEPENFAQHQDLAILIGRPIALVRASLNLELQGPPAVHQGWNTFRQDLERTTRESNDFPAVAFPIRLGAYQQLNDGLVGYWLEQDDGYQNNLFYAMESSPLADAHTTTSAPLHQTLADEPMHISMLIDPRGTIHATCGILPTKAISIPADKYTSALQAIEIIFLTTPVLTDRGKLNLPLPLEPGYQWSWASNGASAIGKVSTQATFAAPQEIREGWLKLSEVPTNSSTTT